MRIARVGLALHLFGHGGGVVGEIAAGAGDAGAIGARRVQPGVGGRVDQQRAAPVAVVERLVEQVLDRLPGIVEGTRPAFDKPRQVGWHQRFSQGHRPRLVEPLAGIFAKGAAQIDDMQARLALERQSLQKQFAEADAVMSRLNSQSGSLANLNNIWGAFTK